MNRAQEHLENLQRRSHYLEVINGFATQLLNAHTVNDIVWTIAKHAIAKLGYEDCIVYLFDDEREYLVQRAAHGPKNPIAFDINNPIKLKVGQGICGHVAMTGQPELIMDTSRDSRYQIDDDMRLSEIAVPMLANGKVIGIIDSEHPENGFYTDQDLEILTTIAAMASLKIVEAEIQSRLENHQAELEKLVDLKTEELREMINQLKDSNEEIKKSHAENEVLLLEIKDSISYAKGIQNAILPSHKAVQDHLKNAFVLYRPKDIIGGDFYWLVTPDNKKDNSHQEILFAVADCTGHGVPGAMVSVVCNNALNRAVREFALRKPGEILDKAREIIHSEFEKSEQIVHDGMDIALCSLAGTKLQYAGANNSIWIVRKDRIIEIKADKQPIGRFERQRPFQTHVIDLQKDDVVYLFSDGIIDQFGGLDGKKFKPSRLRELLLSIQNKSMDEQRSTISAAFIKWKGNHFQVDDVCMIGFKI